MTQFRVSHRRVKAHVRVHFRWSANRPKFPDTEEATGSSPVGPTSKILNVYPTFRVWELLPTTVRFWFGPDFVRTRIVDSLVEAAGSFSIDPVEGAQSGSEPRRAGRPRVLPGDLSTSRRASLCRLRSSGLRILAGRMLLLNAFDFPPERDRNRADEPKCQEDPVDLRDRQFASTPRCDFAN